MKKYILVIGGELFNKGAQAMTFAVVQEIKSAYKDKEVVVLSTDDYNRSESEKSIYSFKILPWNMSMELCLAYSGFALIDKIIKKNKYRKELAEIVEILDNTEAIYDINGYALSSQFTPLMSYLYLLNIRIAKKHKINMYLLPQSFGPFDYKGIHNILIRRMLKKYMKYPKKVFAREKDGYENIKDICSENLVKSYDLVLHTDEPKVENIYIDYKKKSFEIKDNSVAIVPNMQTIKHGNKESLLNIYYSIISFLIKRDKKIYLLSHSNQDFTICKEIQNKFRDNKDVIIINDELSCIEYSSIVDKFDYIIASRYHAIVHAYKKGTPAIVFGWAIKYDELLKRFEQNKYMFDVRNNIDIKLILDAVDNMNEKFRENKNVIINNYKEIKEENIFNW